ncbi:MAG: hypothetical protein KatS3mg076_0797 [Candidatus Binatia bacterium]|nr:MAG: hypothetical protein KatS3mg076_0797 [Candidatus Binatia bacterium]
MVRRKKHLATFLAFCLLALATGVAKAGGQDGKVNVNTASVEELMTLKRIGRVTAERIVAHRNEHGPFRKIEDLLAVRGIGPETLEAFRDQVTVEPVPLPARKPGS